ncbi:MAG: acyltransferase domain-containing protein, partial [Myxococcales bacterium]|nr:acyltransferase domain-containing protein [Myxococcales bacterium]
PQAPDAPETRDTRVAFLFTGQGAQYVEMGKQLYQTLPSFRQTLDACAAVLDPKLARPLLEVMFGNPGDGPSLLDETGFAQPALFALEFALAKLWQGFGVEPSVLLGHSVGEYAAACLAGTMSLEDGLRLIAERGRLMQSLPKLGTMMACSADEDRVARAIEPHRAVVSIAAVNAPGNTVISGETRAIEAIAAALAQQGIKSARLRTSHAFHSPLMEPILDAFERFARGVAFQPPRLPVISNVTGRPAEADHLCSAAYWARHLRAPVRFQDSVAHLAGDGYRIFLEIGPRPTLLAMARQNVQTVQTGQTGPTVDDPRWLPSLKKANEDWAPLLDSVAQLHLAGVDLDWAAFDHAYGRRRVSLPAYAFQRTRCWFDDGAQRPARVRPARLGAHPFLGERVTRTDHVVLFDGAIDLDRLPFLDDHRVHGIVVVPAVVMVEALLAAAGQLRRGKTITLHDVVIHQALALPDDAASRRVQTLLRSLGDGRFAAEILSAIETDDEPTWTRHVTATVELSDHRPAAFVPDLDAPEILVDGPAVYARLAQRQIALGPSFRAVDEVCWRD